MIPISLTIQGLYSYQKKQTVDFTKLTAAGLFGIFGGVGSGKSSILEAITFAIYGETDRLHKRDNRYYNMMNLKSNELLIDFIFESGTEGSVYRAMVTGKRNSKRFDEVKTLDRSAYRRIEGAWVPIDNVVLEKAAGLSYDNFKRTIIIPQGQFQEFLQLGNKDRTQMMKELFNLGKFELGGKVGSLEKKNNEKRQNITGKLQQLGEISPEQADGYQEQLTQLEKEIGEFDLLLEKMQQNEEQLRRLQTIILQREQAAEKYKKLQSQEITYKEQEEKVKRYELCVHRFTHLLDSLKENREKEQERKVILQNDAEKEKSLAAEIVRMEQLMDTLKPDYEKRETLKVKADDLNCLLQIKALEQKIDEETARVKTGEAYFAKTALEVEQLKEEKQHLEKQVKALRDKMPDLSLLSTIHAWHIEKRHFDEQLAENELVMERIMGEERALETEHAALWAQPLFAMLPTDANFAACREELKKTAATIHKKQLVLQEQETHLLVKEKLKNYAEDLEEGNPCPLCGSLHHPARRYQSEDIDGQLQHLAHEKARWETALNQITELEKKTDLLEKSSLQIGRDKVAWQQKKEEQLQKMAAHQRRFVWEKYANREELDQAFAAAKDIETQTKALDHAVIEATAKLEKLAKLSDAARDKLVLLRNALTDHQAAWRTLLQQLKVIRNEQYEGLSSEHIEAEKEQILGTYVRIEQAYRQGSEQLLACKSERERIHTRLETNRNEWQREQQTIANLEKRLTDELKNSDFQSLEEVRLVLAEKMQVDAEKERIKLFNEELLRTRTAWEQFRTEAGDRVYDAVAHQKLITEIRLTKDQKDQKTDERGKISARLEELQKKLENQIILQKEREQLEARAENIRTMKSLFMASGFVNYISSVYLQNLCHAANNRFFQLTRQRLSLEITPDNNFQVRDFMNGGKVRSVKTLSGGQTFQASLSLALALADNIQQVTRSKQNFFFLDEGFGTLDRESLDIVFDTLKSLRKENRIVGLISHVEEMQQEIEVHLRIENNEEKGSIIHRSWE
ncbi:MAG: SbcC/MukB-like Walker B domain-containing protein [Proteiniphilum sp.]